MVDVYKRHVAEVGFGKQHDHFLQMIGKPQVVVVDMGDILSPGLLERRMTPQFPVPLPFWVDESPDTGILPLEISGTGSSFRRSAIANNEKLEVIDRLSQDCVHSQGQEQRRPMNR